MCVLKYLHLKGEKNVLTEVFIQNPRDFSCLFIANYKD